MLGNVLKSQIKLLQLIMVNKQAYSQQHRQPLWASTLHFISFHHLWSLNISVFMTLVLFKVPLCLFFSWVRMSRERSGLPVSVCELFGLDSHSLQKGQDLWEDVRNTRAGLLCGTAKEAFFSVQIWVQFWLDFVLIATGRRSEKTINKIKHGYPEPNRVHTRAEEEDCHIHYILFKY